MGITRCHIKGIFSSAATRYQIVLTVMSLHINNSYAKKRGIKAATMRCGCTSPSLTIMGDTYRVKGMNNGFSSRKDLVRTNPTRKEAKQLKAKRPFAFVIIVHTSSTTPMNTIEKVHTIAVRQGPRSLTC